ncbi:hypothetical protein KP509_14G012600 [Ceratopteris richardii]|uniref:Uncharacterized protein n=1 Tax=Ceratopteris richardii TaxID=49495 RepID=A0A8T2TAB7_CERRI|nr:hypothetical protein KP509_14G012600 [Ceratopteris richardii]
MNSYGCMHTCCFLLDLLVDFEGECGVAGWNERIKWNENTLTR